MSEPTVAKFLCPACNMLYARKRKNQKFCSDACRMRTNHRLTAAKRKADRRKAKVFGEALAKIARCDAGAGRPGEPDPVGIAQNTLEGMP